MGHGRKTQGLFGIKSGSRRDKFGVFGKARPGFIRFGRVFDCPGEDIRSCDEFAHTEFAVDLGGVAEYYPSRRSVLRFDVGDTIIHFRDTIRIANPARIEGGTVHSLQLNIGFGIRF